MASQVISRHSKRPSIDSTPHSSAECCNARFVVDNPDEVAFGTAKAVARAAGVQPSTLVRFAQAAGFSGFSEMQDVLKSNLIERGYSYEHRLKHIEPSELGSPKRIFEGFVANAQSALQASAQELDDVSLARAVRLLTKARTAHFLGVRR